MSDLQKQLLIIKKFLNKGHRSFCQHHYINNPHCTCGLKKALEAYNEILTILKNEPKV